MSVPLLFVAVSDAVIHVTDTAFLGRVGTAELAAFALAGALVETLAVPVIGLSEAMQIVIARRVGQQRLDAVGSTFVRGMLLILAVSTALAVLLHLAAPVIAGTLAGSPTVAVAMERFLSIAAYGVVFLSLSLGYSALYVGLARTVVLAAATAVLAATNLVLSYALILGKLGQPRLGIEGAAWSFVLAELAALLFLTVYTAARYARRHAPAMPAAPGVATFGPLLRLSPPVALQALLDGVRWLAFFVIVQQISEEALAWSNVVYACYLVLLIPSGAIAESTNALVSTLIGQGRTADVMRLTSSATRISYAITAPFAVVAVLAPGLIVGLFTEDPAVVAGAAPVLQVVALAMVVIIPAELWLAAVAGTGATGTAFVIELTLSVVVLVGAYTAALPLGLSLPYVWASLGAAALVALALSQWWLTHKPVKHF